jgi:hypothetical protein
MTSGTTGSMRSTPQAGGYLADMIARWLGMGGGGAQGPQQLFPGGLGGGPLSPAQESRIATPTGGNGMAPMLPSVQGVPGIGPLGPNASLFDDAGAYGGTAASQQYGTGFKRPGTPQSNVPRAGVSPAAVPGVNAGVPGTRASQGLGGSGSMYGGRPTGDLNSAGGYGGAGSAQALLAAILGGGGRY